MCALHNYKHGHRGSRGGKPSLEYSSWSGVKKRVFNPKDKLYPYYGGRGIDMDPNWQDFCIFLADVGPAPDEKHSLERVDNSLGYWKHNVKWATRQEQACNKRSTIRVNWLGRETCLKEACVSFGWAYKTVHGWRKKGYTDQQIKERAEVLWAKDQTSQG